MTTAQAAPPQDIPGFVESTAPSQEGNAPTVHDDHGHDHTSQINAQEAGDPKVTALVIAGAVAVLIAAAVLFLKKKK